MAFTFGSSAPAAPTPATATGGFSFGSSAPAPTPAVGGGGGLFGAATTTTNTTPTSSNATGGGAFSFGGAATPAAPAAGSAFSFGSTTPAPAAGAPSAFSFGGSTTPAAPAFGAPAAPTAAAPTTSLFGAPTTPGAPAPSSFGFGGGVPAAPAALGGAAPQAPQTISGKTPYAALPPAYKAAIDAIHQSMMQHKRCMSMIQSTGPEALVVPLGGSGSSYLSLVPTGGPATGNSISLPLQIQELQHRIVLLKQSSETLQRQANLQRDALRQTVKQGIFYAKWPTEAVAARRGIRLPGETAVLSSTTKPGKPGGGPGTTALGGPSAGATGTGASSASSLVSATTISASGSNHQRQHPGTAALLRDALDRQLPYLDRIERMPSPYYWQLLEQLEQQTVALEEQIKSLQTQLQGSLSFHPDTVNLRNIVDLHEAALHRLGLKFREIAHDMNNLRQIYTMMETQENVVDRARLQEWESHRKLHEQIQMQELRAQAKVAPSTPALPPPPTPLTGTPAPTATAPFAFSTAPPAATAASTTPAPSAFSFGGGTPAPGATTPAPLFGASPAPSTFGTPATPATGGLFGGAATPAAPATSTFSFGAAAPTSGTPAFGATSGFGAAAPVTTNTPKKKSATRNRRR